MEKRDKGLPEGVTEAILKYLDYEELVAGEDEGYVLKDSCSGLLPVHGILDEIPGKIALRAKLIEDFQARLEAHNQHPLFDLAAIIPDFFIDNSLFENLTFRETLVVNKKENLVPRIVGELRLDVQNAKGESPSRRKDTGLEQKLIELLTLKAANKPNAGESTPTSPEGASADLLSKSENDPTQSNPELEEFVASIETCYEHANCKFLVHASSQFDAGACEGGSRITAWVDRNFHTLEEKRTEYTADVNGINEKTLYCALQPRSYFVKCTSTVDKIDDKKYYDMGKMRDLVSEGANFVLMRYLALTRYIGTFELSAMYINGDICRNIYKCLGPESGLVNEQKLDLCKIYRTIVEACGIVHECVTVLTLHGQIVTQEWNDCDYILQVHPLAHISNEKPCGKERLKLEKVWETDMHLRSEFLDYKTVGVRKMQSYLADHPEFRNMMADYVQSLLLIKPDDVLDFTVQHFIQYFPQHTRGNGSFTNVDG